jgi:CheY-like chemotaxis protein
MEGNTRQVPRYGFCVLVVDDNRMVRTLVRRCMESLAEVKICEEAVNGQDGVHKTLELKPDLIILDHRMPEINGLEVARLLRQSMPDVLLILFTSYADEVTESSARDSGISGVIDKSNLTRLVRFIKGLMAGV